MSSLERLERRARALLRSPVETALVAYVPEAAPLLAVAGRPVSRDGELPPHVTVLYPFVAPRALDAATATLRDVLATWPAFSWHLAGIGRFPGVVYLAVEPAAPFVALTRAVWGRFPEHPPYGGAFAEIVPHVTLSEHGEPPAVDAVAERLPVIVTTTSLALVRRDRAGWHHVADLPLAPSPSR